MEQTSQPDQQQHPLEKWRTETGQTVEEVCKLLEIGSRTTYYRYLRGLRTPRPDMIRRIERVTRHAVTRDHFIDGVAA